MKRATIFWGIMGLVLILTASRAQADALLWNISTGRLGVTPSAPVATLYVDLSEVVDVNIGTVDAPIHVWSPRNGSSITAYRVPDGKAVTIPVPSMGYYVENTGTNGITYPGTAYSNACTMGSYCAAPPPNTPTTGTTGTTGGTGTTTGGTGTTGGLSSTTGGDGGGGCHPQITKLEIRGPQTIRVPYYNPTVHGPAIYQAIATDEMGNKYRVDYVHWSLNQVLGAISLSPELGHYGRYTPPYFAKGESFTVEIVATFSGHCNTLTSQPLEVSVQDSTVDYSSLYIGTYSSTRGNTSTSASLTKTVDPNTGLATGTGTITVTTTGHAPVSGRAAAAAPSTSTLNANLSLFSDLLGNEYGLLSFKNDPVYGSGMLAARLTETAANGATKLTIDIGGGHIAGSRAGEIVLNLDKSASPAIPGGGTGIAGAAANTVPASTDTRTFAHTFGSSPITVTLTRTMDSTGATSLSGTLTYAKTAFNLVGFVDAAGVNYVGLMVEDDPYLGSGVVAGKMTESVVNGVTVGTFDFGGGQLESGILGELVLPLEKQ